jgi:hypothetical protein
MKKVFCKNCKYYEFVYTANGDISMGRRSLCKLKHRIEINCIGYKRIYCDESFCEDLNINCDCNLYKRKWWKFWIK